MDQAMDEEAWNNHVRELADSRCRNKHPDYYDSLICVGPGSENGFGPPCDGCVRETTQELETKRQKAVGVELSAEEAAAVRKQLGIED